MILSTQLIVHGIFDQRDTCTVSHGLFEHCERPAWYRVSDTHDSLARMLIAATNNNTPESLPVQVCRHHLFAIVHASCEITGYAAIKMPTPAARLAEALLVS